MTADQPTDQETLAPTSRTYLAALADGGGTVPVELGAVRRLVERGHRVTVLGEDSFEAEVRVTGATFRRWDTAPNRPDRLPANDPVRDWEVRSPMRLFDRLIDTQLVGPAPAYAADVAVAIAEQRPDAILSSQFTIGAMAAAEAAGIPFAVLMPNIYTAPADGMPPLGAGFRPARGPLGRLRDRAVFAVTGRAWDRKGLAGLNALRADLGLAPLDSFWEQVHRAERHVVMTSAAFDFPARLPDHARYVGPVLDDPAWAEPWTPPPGDEPLVLVGLSSSFQDQEASLRRIVEALGALPIRAVVTTGPALPAGALTGPPNVSIVASAPHAEVLRHAAAVITHGGHGTVVKALAAGVPLVVMHHGRDQADNAARVVARGAGLTVKRTARPASIAAAVRHVLDDPGYRTAAGRLGDALRADAASDRLVSTLEDVTAVGVRPSPS